MLLRHHSSSSFPIDRPSFPWARHWDLLSVKRLDEEDFVPRGVWMFYPAGELLIITAHVTVNRFPLENRADPARDTSAQVAVLSHWIVRQQLAEDSLCNTQVRPANRWSQVRSAISLEFQCIGLQRVRFNLIYCIISTAEDWLVYLLTFFLMWITSQLVTAHWVPEQSIGMVWSNFISILVLMIAQFPHIFCTFDHFISNTTQKACNKNPFFA